MAAGEEAKQPKRPENGALAAALMASSSSRSACLGRALRRAYLHLTRPKRRMAAARRWSSLALKLAAQARHLVLSNSPAAYQARAVSSSRSGHRAWGATLDKLGEIAMP